MEYKELTVTCSHKYADIIAAILSDGNYQGIAIWDKEDYLELSGKGIWDYKDEEELSDEVKIRAYFYPDNNLQNFIEELDNLKNFNEDFEYSYSVEIKDDANSQKDWREYFEPIIMDKIAIIPEWEKDFSSEKITVIINPSMAFGTGTHSTTRMCLEALQHIDLTDKIVLDVGCGSGILGIAALKLGAGNVSMIDIDDNAVKSAKENVMLNGLKDNITIKNGTINSFKDNFADIIAANITADILISLKDEFKRVLKKGGTLILSGIIDIKTNVLEKAFEAFDKKLHISEDCWHCFHYENKQANNNGELK